MDNKEKKGLFPKGDDGRYRDIMMLHIQGLALVLVLILALGSSVTILLRSIISMLAGGLGTGVNPEDLSFVLDAYGFGSFAESAIKLFQSVTAAFASLGGAVIIIIFMKRRIADIIDEGAPYENPVRVKKAAFVWLGFLLGAYGGHLFVLKKKKAWVFLLLGIVGKQIIPLFIYTSGISFADAFMACFIEKDENGFIEMEDYPYWI